MTKPREKHEIDRKTIGTMVDRLVESRLDLVTTLLDVLDDGWDYRYRVYGSEIAQLARRDYTGMRTSELNVRAVVPMFCIAGYRAVARRRIPLYTRNLTPPEVSTQSWSRLILPLVDAEGGIARFLAGNVPGPWRAVT